MAMNWKTIKIPQWAYENALLVMGDLLAGGFVPPRRLLAPTRCPRCKSELDVVTLDYSGVACTACNFKQERFEASGTNASDVAVGVLLGLGLTALLASTVQRADTRRTRAAQALRRAASPNSHRLTSSDIAAEVRASRKGRRKTR